MVDDGEELQRLDDDLADGRLDATSYRRRRDELIVRRREEEAAARPTTARAAGKGPATAPGSGEGTGSAAAVPVSAGPAFTAGPVSGPATAWAAPAAEPPRRGFPGAESSGAGPSSVGAEAPDVSGTTAAPPTPPRTPPERDPAEDTTSFPAAGASPDPAADLHRGRRPSPDPFPPPFRWGEPPTPAGPSADVTQVVDRDAESTQVVPDPTSGGPGRPVPPPGPPPGPPPNGPASGGFRPPSFPPPERTQVVPGGLAGRRPSPPVAAAQTTPPWVERDPDRRDRPPSGMQGSEVFLGRRRELASVIGTAAVVVVVILILALSFTLG